MLTRTCTIACFRSRESSLMEQATAAPLKKTPLNARHRASGAKMVPFAGWDMPVEYSGIVAEHMAVRERAGLFDVSHMGEIEIAGKDALAAVQRISSNDARKLAVGQAQYSGLLTPQGTFVDDLLVYRLAPDALPARRQRRQHPDRLRAGSPSTSRAGAGDAVAVDASSRYALLALQGPAALERAAAADRRRSRRASSTTGSRTAKSPSVRATISRTGYTGEDGFEIFVPPQSADRVWQAILDAGTRAGVIPCGLGARDTLRLEAAMRLHGNDIDQTTTAVEADLGWIVGWKKDDFVGADALRAQKADGPRAQDRRLRDARSRHRAPRLRRLYRRRQGRPASVTSGTQTPFLKKAIGMAYLPVDHTAVGTEFDVDIRGRATRARVVPMPFYKREVAQAT